MDASFSADIYISFPERDRFDYPPYIERVTGGYGGESMLIFGDEKACIYDCGMAYCHETLIENIENALEKHGKKTLDCVIISHTHYDHIGALPYIIRRWPQVVVYGAEKAVSVFKSQGARDTMKRLGKSAAATFGNGDEEILVDPLRVDVPVRDGDTISLGSLEIEVIETKGHTDCSLTYLIKPYKLMIASESTGVLRSSRLMHNAFIKSFAMSIESAKKLSAMDYNDLIIPHFGIVPRSYAKEHFNKYIECAEAEKQEILKWRDEGLSLEEIYKAFEEKYWNKSRNDAQPYEAFVENYVHSIGHILKNY
ncbi:MAG: MBL fold metallo-hydrolase [Peptostreptococcaceae bacterium]|nr:MBL fold metallo-hydrolase [Peptostreptococcaceae bacterium]MDY5739015.1 MBL fold metallo-hydrolase [Anaerovoracaceae bacterium]SFE08365.1 Glyoxylase, beta-lactamase superfamily II [Peptostreptococcaceae bacterium pGA-8]